MKYFFDESQNAMLADHFKAAKSRLRNAFNRNQDSIDKQSKRRGRKMTNREIIKYSFLAIDTIKSIPRCESGTRAGGRRATCDK